ncbi:MAG TPA: peptide chain release factor N(5)-glutamine methyltransferase [Bacteroidales bacterium]|nr:peptide chain release factor N(5)-glutamine methyltransferase [Bacteroidales bacterium]HBZ19693.1 peptide chain release factor N(5)-glutamine methyltransferase [Bacteroidales bacterium]
MACNLQTIKDIRNYISGELSGLYPEKECAGISNIIISKLFEMNRISSLMKEDEILTDTKKIEKVIRYCRKLKTGEPVQYVIGETIFYDCLIKVSRGVLIPRPETEELVDHIIQENKGFTGSVLDIGTGSGCIAVALGINLPSAGITGIDKSRRSVKTAIRNAELNKSAVSFLEADLFKLKPSQIPNADIIVSNPPYVRYSEMKFMHRNVLDFEPHRALFVPDDDPLKFYRAILDLTGSILNPSGSVWFEINEVMGESVHELMKSYNLHCIKIIKDINGKDRIAKGKKDA